jgi:ADP-ribose pyrophosphatase YjhB (NUDIX family)
MITLILENDFEHAKTLSDTGYWGKMGAGAIIFAKDTKRFCLQLRSAFVEQPNTWGTWGGAVDSGMSPNDSVKKEIAEEASYSGSIDLIPIYVFRDKAFSYHNFLGVVEKEFTPLLNWEAQDYRWFEFGEWPSPLHFGVQSILGDKHSVEVMKKQAAIS